MSKIDSSTKRKYLRYAAIALAVVFCLSAILLVMALWEKHNSEYDYDYSGSFKETLEYNGEKYTARDDVEAMLLIGLDKLQGVEDSTAYNNDKSADFLLLLVFDNTNKTCKGIQINRDTIAEMNVLGVAGDKIGSVKQQIALSHTYGNGKEVSCRNTVDSVSELLYGVNIKHYLSVTMEAVSIYNDLVGGVPVTVLDDFTGIDETLVKGEKTVLYGEHALTYVRGRYGVGDNTNINRMKRQRQYVESLYAQTQSAAEKNERFQLDAISKLSEYTVSDCTVNQMQTIFEKFSTYEFGGITEIKGESIVGEQFMEFYPSDASMKSAVIELFYKKD